MACIASCTDRSRLPFAATVGPEPVLPEAEERLIPVVNIAKAEGWPAGRMPISPPGLQVTAFASGLDHPRWIHVLPEGGVLVAETSAPERPQEGTGLKARITMLLMKRAGSAVPSADRITLLRDLDGDGIAETRSTFLEGLHSPFGMAVVGEHVYIANTDAIVRFPYRAGETRISALGEKVTDLPAGPRNHHWTKNIVASPDGTKLYATVGSNSNVAEHGMQEEEGRAAIWEVDLTAGTKRLFATGLRNPNGMAWEPATGVLWTVVNERDELGNDLVPDYLTSVRDGAFYGWPYCYFGRQVDPRVEPPRPDLVESATRPDYSLGSHVAALGLAFSTSNTLGYPEGVFIGQHGSWNRKPRVGYNVVFIPFQAGRPSGAPVEVLTGFVTNDGTANGRPVAVAVDASGGLLVADDVGNTVWKVSGPAGRPPSALLLDRSDPKRRG